jgi:hypothetical protein
VKQDVDLVARFPPASPEPEPDRIDFVAVLKALADPVRLRVRGREHAVQLRRDDLDARFPGLLGSVLAGAADVDA